LFASAARAAWCCWRRSWVACCACVFMGVVVSLLLVLWFVVRLGLVLLGLGLNSSLVSHFDPGIKTPADLLVLGE